jgi:hypothetical protein
MDTFNYTEYPKMQEYVARRKEVKGEDPSNRKWKIKHRQS